jgi:hypothetical protein
MVEMGRQPGDPDEAAHLAPEIEQRHAMGNQLSAEIGAGDHRVS